MKNIIILAAGIGSRLRPLTENKPKSLIGVNGTPLLERLVTQIHNHNPHHQINVVAGYLNEQIYKSMNNIGFDVNVIVNKNFESTNNMESCRLALETMEYKDCVIINADCIYDDGIVHKVLDADKSIIAIDSSEYFEENMKVKLIDGKVSEISKDIQDTPEAYTSIDIYNFIKTDVDKLLMIMKSYNSKGDLNKWNEVAINDILPVTSISTHDFKGYSWVEIDNLEDLSKAEQVFL